MLELKYEDVEEGVKGLKPVRPSPKTGEDETTFLAAWGDPDSRSCPMAPTGGEVGGVERASPERQLPTRETLELLLLRSPPLHPTILESSLAPMTAFEWSSTTIIGSNSTSTLLAPWDDPAPCEPRSNLQTPTPPRPYQLISSSL